MTGAGKERYSGFVPSFATKKEAASEGHVFNFEEEIKLLRECLVSKWVTQGLFVTRLTIL